MKSPLVVGIVLLITFSSIGVSKTSSIPSHRPVPESSPSLDEVPGTTLVTGINTESSTTAPFDISSDDVMSTPEAGLLRNEEILVEEPSSSFNSNLNSTDTTSSNPETTTMSDSVVFVETNTLPVSADKNEAGRVNSEIHTESQTEMTTEDVEVRTDTAAAARTTKTVTTPVPLMLSSTTKSRTPLKMSNASRSDSTRVHHSNAVNEDVKTSDTIKEMESDINREREDIEMDSGGKPQGSNESNTHNEMNKSSTLPNPIRNNSITSAPSPTSSVPTTIQLNNTSNSNISSSKEEVAKELSDIWDYSQSLGDNSESKDLKATLSSVVRLAYARLDTEEEDTLHRLKYLLEKLRERIGLTTTNPIDTDTANSTMNSSNSPDSDKISDSKAGSESTRVKRAFSHTYSSPSSSSSSSSSYSEHPMLGLEEESGMGEYEVVPLSSHENSLYSSYFKYNVKKNSNPANAHANTHTKPINLLNTYYSNDDTSGEILSTVTPSEKTIQKVVLVQDMDTTATSASSSSSSTRSPLEFLHKNYGELEIQSSMTPSPTIFFPPLKIPLATSSKNKNKNKYQLNGKHPSKTNTNNNNNDDDDDNNFQRVKPPQEFQFQILPSKNYQKVSYAPLQSAMAIPHYPEEDSGYSSSAFSRPIIVPDKNSNNNKKQQQHQQVPEGNPDQVSVDQIASAIVKLLYPTVQLENPLSTNNNSKNPTMLENLHTNTNSDSNSNENENENDSTEPATSSVFTFPVHKDMFLNKLALLNQQQQQQNSPDKNKNPGSSFATSSPSLGSLYHLTTTKPQLFPTYLQFHPLPVLQLPNGTIAALPNYPPLFQHLINHQIHNQGLKNPEKDNSSVASTHMENESELSDPEEAEAEADLDSYTELFPETTTILPAAESNTQSNNVIFDDNYLEQTKNFTHSMLLQEEEDFSGPDLSQQFNFKIPTGLQNEAVEAEQNTTTTTTTMQTPIIVATAAPPPSISVIQTNTVKVPGTPVIQILEELTDSNIMSAPATFINGTREGFVQFITTLGTLSFTTKMVMVFALSISILSIVLGVYSLGPPIIAVGILGIMIPISILLLLQDSSRNRVKNPQGKITPNFQEEMYYILKLVETAFDKYENHYI